MSRKKKANETQENYLDLIPERSKALRWHEDLKGRMVLEVENTGIFNTIAQKIFQKPKYTKVHLDEMGTFVWPLIDGEKTVEGIGELVKEQFGEKAEPLYPRLIKYFQIMESYHFIYMSQK